MLPVNNCPECGVPEQFGQAQVWLNNGDIVMSIFEGARVAFVECENLDPVFKNIEDIIGVSIEPLLINITARGNKMYLYRMIPKRAREMIRTKSLDVMPLVETLTTLAQLSGYARYELVDYRYGKGADDFARHRIINPFSLPMAVGAYAGAVSGIVGGDASVSYGEVEPGEYLLTAYATEYPKELTEKLRLHDYKHKEGGLELERCGSCGVPKALSHFQWHPDEGLIKHRRTGRRMALLGPEQLDPVFNELETELGESIPGIVVEAQRRFVKTGFYPIDALEDEEDVRTQLALRGLGNLQSLEMDKRGLRMRLNNACLHLLVTGLVQGIFELNFDIESKVDWELSEEGDLELEVIPS